MAYRLEQLEVTEAEPYKYDVLNRKPIVQFLAGLIERAGGPFVLALDSPWGTGKTTTTRMLQAELMQNQFGCIYFNAWKVDYVTDPLVALVSSLDSFNLKSSANDKVFKEHMKKVKNITSLLAKRAIIAGAKAITFGALELDEEYKAIAEELAGDSADDIVESFKKESILLENFRKELEQAISQLPSDGKKPTLVFFIDEIDRCRPTFAIELLERIKHLFDVENILFVLSLDKQQLQASIASVYGVGINSAEYLRRFIDLEYELPAASSKQFVTSLFSRFGLDEVFAKRTHHELIHDKQNFIAYFSELAQAISMSLRAQERCFTRLCVVMDQTPDNYYLEPIMVALLIALRSNNPALYKALVSGQATAKDLFKYLNGLTAGEILTSGRTGEIIEGYLIHLDIDDARSENIIKEYKAVAADEKQPKIERERALEVVRFIDHLNSQSSRTVKLSKLAIKIDLSADIKD